MIKKTFVLKDSWINKIHPGIRVLTAILCALSIALSYELTTLSISLCTAILLILTIGLETKLILKGIIASSSFILFVWLILPLAYLIKTSDIFLANEVGTLIVLTITLKTLSISLFSISLVGTMELVTLGYSLRLIRIPKKMVILILLTYRYIFLIAQEYLKLTQGLKVRGFQARTNKHTYKTYAYVIGMLLIRAHERAERVHHAMICRNFSGEFLSLKKYRFNWQSHVFMVLTLTFVTIIFFMK